VFSFTAPLNDGSCISSTIYNFTDGRGYSWAAGGAYNHYFGPNALQFDCTSNLMTGPLETRYSAFTWRAARSVHPGQANLLLADGSVRGVNEAIDPRVWQGISTRNGQEAVTLP
jgi:prepilin-type processing-associated H-X9-DG protein